MRLEQKVGTSCAPGRKYVMQQKHMSLVSTLSVGRDFLTRKGRMICCSY